MAVDMAYFLLLYLNIIFRGLAKYHQFSVDGKKQKTGDI